jgi:hypothetical protein
MRFLDPAEANAGPADDGMRVRIGDVIGRVAGHVLEAVVGCERDDPVAGYLFFTTLDVPDEDALTITLTDPGLRILDHAWLGGLYATGTWRDAAIEGAGRMRFRFIDDKVWRLALLPAPALRPLRGEPRGSHRSVGLWRHFTLLTD